MALEANGDMTIKQLAEHCGRGVETIRQHIYNAVRAQTVERGPNAPSLNPLAQKEHTYRLRTVKNTTPTSVFDWRAR